MEAETFQGGLPGYQTPKSATPGTRNLDTPWWGWGGLTSGGGPHFPCALALGLPVPGGSDLVWFGLVGRPKKVGDLSERVHETSLNDQFFFPPEA